jgi:hypothetical protein
MMVTITARDDGHYAVSFDYDAQIIALLKAAVPSRTRRWDADDREWVVDIAYPVRCFVEALRYRGHDVIGDIPEMPSCRDCGAPLSVHNITGLCRECRLIATNERLGQQPDPAAPVSYADAIANITAVLPIDDPF